MDAVPRLAAGVVAYVAARHGGEEDGEDALPHEEAQVAHLEGTLGAEGHVACGGRDGVGV